MPADSGLIYDTTKIASVTITSSYGNTLKSSDYPESVVTIDASARNKAINIEGNKNNNSIIGGSSNDTLGGGAGNDTLTGNGGNDVFIYTAGNDVITDYTRGDSVKIAESISAYSASGNDVTFKVGSGSVKIVGGKGQEITIVDANNKSGLYLDGLIYNATAAKATAISVTSAYGNTLGADNYSSTVATIDASTRTAAMNITGNNKANRIIGSSGNDTLNGGTGNDTMTGGNGNDVFIHSAGNDVITDYAEGADTLKIVDNTVTSYIANGNDLILKIGNGSVKISGGKTSAITIIDSNSSYTYQNNLLYNNLVAKATAVSILSNYANTLAAEAYGTAVLTIDASAHSKAMDISGNDKNNIIVGTSDNDTLFGGNGTDTIYGGAGNDSLSGGAGNDTLNGGRGNDTFTGGDGNDVFIFESGRDVVTDYVETQDTIRFANDTLANYSISGNDLVLTVESGAVRVIDGATKAVTAIDSANNSLTFQNNLIYNNLVTKATAVTVAANYGNTLAADAYGTAVLTINASAHTDPMKISGNAKNNSILGTAGNDTISGGSGNDTLTGGDGADLFIYEAGNAVINDYTAEDTLKIASGTITSITFTGEDMTFKVGSGSVKINGVKSGTLNLIDADNKNRVYDSGVIYNDTATSAANAVTITSGFDGAFDDYSASVITIDASARTAAINVTGNSKANRIIGTGNNDTFYGGNGNDYLYGDKGNDFLSGDRGNDTLYGGAGNDTLTGGAGRDVFIYETGNDVITDYKENEDFVSVVSGSITGYSINGKDAILKIGSGMVTLQNAAESTIRILNAGGIPSTELKLSTDTADTNSTVVSALIFDESSTAVTITTMQSENFAAANYSDLVSIDARERGAIRITGNNNDNVIIGSTGNDTITGGAGRDTFVYYGENDMDVIRDYNAGEDFISLASGSIVGGMLVGSNVVLVTETGSIKLTSAKNKTVIVLDGDTQRQYVNGVYIPPNLSIDNTENDTLVAGEDGNDTLSNSGYDVTLTGGGGNDIFINKGGSAVITDYTSGEDYIQTNNARIIDASIVGKNVVLSTSNGVLTIIGGANSALNINGVNTIIGGGGGEVTGSGTVIDNTRNNTFIGGTPYNDTLSNSGENVTVSGGDGNDIFIHKGGSLFITDYTGGEDTIQIENATIASAINSGENDIVISTSNGMITLLDSKGEAINVNGNIISIRDDPTAINNKYNSTLVSGSPEQDNKITNSGVNVTIEAALGNDSITNTGANTKINGDAGNDTITNNAYGVLMEGNRGDDVITNSGNNATIYASYGNDTITNYGNRISLEGENALIDGGYGDDRIFNYSGDRAKISGGYGEDTIFSSGENVTISGGDGADIFMYGGGSAIITDYTPGLDKLQILSGDILEATGDGNNVMVSLTNGALTLLGVAGETVNLDGIDTVIGEKITAISVNNTTDGALITGTEYDDTLSNSGENVTLTGGAGKDIFIHEGGTAVITDYAAGEDSIQIDTVTDAKISGSSVILNEALTVVGGKNQTLNINGVDTVISESGISINSAVDNTLISGTAYGDTLASSGNNVIMFGGAGKDIFIHEGGTAIITDYTSGEDSIQIGTITRATNSGNNVILSANGGTLTIFNAKDATLNINGADTVIGASGISVSNDADDTLITGTEYDDTLASSGENVTLTGGAGADIFIHEGGSATITDYASGEDSIQIGTITEAALDGDDVIISTDNGFLAILNGKDEILNLNGVETVIAEPETPTELTITNATTSPLTVDAGIRLINATARTTSLRITANSLSNTVYGGSGVDTVYGGAGDDLILGYSGNDKLYGEAGNDTLNGGAGTNSLTGGAGNDVFVYDGGSVIINDYTPGQDVIRLANGTISKSSVSGSNVILTVNTNNITVKSGSGKTLSIIDSTGNNFTTIVGGNSSSSTTVTTAVTITNTDASPVTVASAVLTIDASKRSKAIQITGNAKSNTIMGGTSYDTIYGGAGNDSINGNKGNDYLYGEAGNDIVHGGDGNDYLNGGAGTDTLYGEAGNDTLYGDAGNDYIDGGAGVDKLYGDDGADTIYGGDGNDSIDGGEGADKLYGDAGNDTIYGGAGNDSIEGGAGTDKLYGGAGNDTLYGGAGADTLTGDAGNDVFVYGDGDGKDVITDYTAGQDKIKITSGTISKTTYSGNNVVFTIGTGTLTVNNGKGQKITITDANNKTTTQTYGAVSGSSSLLINDNNFITNETRIDDIFKVTATADYSNGDYSTMNYQNLAQNQTYISYAKK